ncbi:putative phospholipase B-like 2 isoform X4 [Rhipicephalus microplus]|uniref:putative phospholipase B-like 2 isoform X4 n=1 Tax=Rhipicephalus microplus TaxID=6941 RepID=UPI003F6CEA11
MRGPLLPFLLFATTCLSTSADFRGWMRKVREEPPLFEIVEGETRSNSPVWGSFVDRYSTQGYGFLELYSNESYSDRDQAFNAGIFEGYATADRAIMHYDNLWKQYCAHQVDSCVKLFQFIGATLNYMQQQATELAVKDPYWHQVDMVLTQLNAISAGITARQNKVRFFSPQDVDITRANMLLFLNLDGEVDDIEARLRPVTTSGVNVDEPMAGRRADSALVKLLPGNKDLLLSHVSGGPYAGMTKILKKYSLNLHTSAKSKKKIAGRVHATSSSPGKLTSGDDFYLLSNGLALMSTGIEVHNNSLYRFITPNCVFEFVRAIVANRLATSATEWINIYSKNPSGTNSKQWMIVDYNKFKPAQQIPDGLLWIMESLPGFTHTEDVSAVLRKQSYWPSYNIPYNGFKEDPASKCVCIPPFSATNGISARSDLNILMGRYPFPALGPASRGGIDMKLTNTSLAVGLQFIAVAGPTQDLQPPFRWSTSGFHDPHDGQPDLWNFTTFVWTWGKAVGTHCAEDCLRWRLPCLSSISFVRAASEGLCEM